MVATKQKSTHRRTMNTNTENNYTETDNILNAISNVLSADELRQEIKRFWSAALPRTELEPDSNKLIDTFAESLASGLRNLAKEELLGVEKIDELRTKLENRTALQLTVAKLLDGLAGLSSDEKMRRKLDMLREGLEKGMDENILERQFHGA